MCDLTNTINPSIWEADVKMTYGHDSLPSYIATKRGLFRRNYPTKEFEEMEIISSLTKVEFHCIMQNSSTD